MSIYSIQVHFPTAPTPLEVGAMLEVMTGFSSGMLTYEEGELWLTHPAHPAHPIRLGWWTDRLQGHAQLEATLHVQSPLPFPTYPVTIILDAEPINTRAHSYLRNVALAALLQLGGVTEYPFTFFPSWANQPWQQVPARNLWQKIKSFYSLEF
jgi:hypothetical protein